MRTSKLMTILLSTAALASGAAFAQAGAGETTTNTGVSGNTQATSPDGMSSNGTTGTTKTPHGTTRGQHRSGKAEPAEKKAPTPTSSQSMNDGPMSGTGVPTERYPANNGSSTGTAGSNMGTTGRNTGNSYGAAGAGAGPNMTTTNPSTQPGTTGPTGGGGGK